MTEMSVEEKTYDPMIVWLQNMWQIITFSLFRDKSKDYSDVTMMNTNGSKLTIFVEICEIVMLFLKIKMISNLRLTRRIDSHFD